MPLDGAEFPLPLEKVVRVMRGVAMSVGGGGTEVLLPIKEEPEGIWVPIAAGVMGMLGDGAEGGAVPTAEFTEVETQPDM